MSASNDRDVARVVAAACEPGRGRQPGEGAEFVDQVRLVVEAAVNGDAGPVDGAVAVHLCDQAPEPLQARVALGLHPDLFAEQLAKAARRQPAVRRSEERRVGKRCGRTYRSPWSPYH